MLRIWKFSQQFCAQIKFLQEVDKNSPSGTEKAIETESASATPRVSEFWVKLDYKFYIVNWTLYSVRFYCKIVGRNIGTS